MHLNNEKLNDIRNCIFFIFFKYNIINKLLSSSDCTKAYYIIIFDFSCALIFDFLFYQNEKKISILYFIFEELKQDTKKKL